MNRIMINKALCDGCLNCVLACMIEHNPKGKSIYKLDLEDASNESRNHIELDENNKPVPIFCRHCDEPECVTACMSGAMQKDEVTGVVSCDSSKCAGCYMCIMSCPYGVLKSDSVTKKVIIKCDLCLSKGTPACVESCPTGAIYVNSEVKTI